jgi:hypothetical protein
VDDPGGGITSVRWIHNGFLGGDWEAEYEALKEGDPAMLFKLDQFLRYFRGRSAKPITAFGPPVTSRGRGWPVFRQRLGLTGEVALDQLVRLTPEGLSPIEGVVHHLSPNILGVRSDRGLHQFVHGFQDSSFVGHHIFTDVGGDTEEAWQDWLARTFG